MKKSNIFIRVIILSQIVASAYACGMQAPVQSLSGYNFTSAAVLPVTYFDKQGKPVKYVILAREAAGKDVGTYDDFGGSRDQGEKHPVATAAREFFEEGILQSTLGMSQQQVRDHIDLTSKTNTAAAVVASRQAVTYIVNFTADEIHKFKKNFHAALAQQTSYKYKEKDRIATVRWDLFEAAIKNSKPNTEVKVQARLVDPQTGKDEKSQTEITLRPFFVKTLRPYIENQAYEAGKDARIRFYK